MWSNTSFSWRVRWLTALRNAMLTMPTWPLTGPCLVGPDLFRPSFVHAITSLRLSVFFWLTMALDFHHSVTEMGRNYNRSRLGWKIDLGALSQLFVGASLAPAIPREAFLEFFEHRKANEPHDYFMYGPACSILVRTVASSCSEFPYFFC